MIAHSAVAIRAAERLEQKRKHHSRQTALTHTRALSSPLSRRISRFVLFSLALSLSLSISIFVESDSENLLFITLLGTFLAHFSFGESHSGAARTLFALHMNQFSRMNAKLRSDGKKLSKQC